MNWRRILTSTTLIATVLGSVTVAAAPKKDAKAKGKPPTEEQMKAGQQVFNTICAACHRPDGTGMPGMFPPLAKSEFLMADKERSIKIVLGGIQGPLEVNGQKYNQVMPPLAAQLKDEQIAAVLSYVRNSFGNKGEAVTTEEVAKSRAAGVSVQSGASK